MNIHQNRRRESDERKTYAVNGGSQKMHNRILLLAMHYVTDPTKRPEDQHADVVRIQYMIDILGLKTLSYARLTDRHVGYVQSSFEDRIDMRGFDEIQKPDVVALDYRWLQDEGYFVPGSYGDNWFRYTSTERNNNGKIGKCIAKGVKAVLIPNNQGGNVKKMYKDWLKNVEDKSCKVHPMTLAESEKYHPLVVATMYSNPKDPRYQHAFVATRSLACYKMNRNRKLILDEDKRPIPTDEPAFYCCYDMDLSLSHILQILHSMCRHSMHEEGSIHETLEADLHQKTTALRQVQDEINMHIVYNTYSVWKYQEKQRQTVQLNKDIYEIQERIEEWLHAPDAPLESDKEIFQMLEHNPTSLVGRWVLKHSWTKQVSSASFHDVKAPHRVRTGKAFVGKVVHYNTDDRTWIVNFKILRNTESKIVTRIENMDIYDMQRVLLLSKRFWPDERYYRGLQMVPWAQALSDFTPRSPEKRRAEKRRQSAIVSDERNVRIKQELHARRNKIVLDDDGADQRAEEYARQNAITLADYEDDDDIALLRVQQAEGDLEERLGKEKAEAANDNRVFDFTADETTEYERSAQEKADAAKDNRVFDFTED